MSARIYVGNLPVDVRARELDDMFYKYGKIRDIDIKRPRRGGDFAFAFVDFDDYRDAQDACRGRDGIDFARRRIRVEISRKRGGRDSRREPCPFRLRVTGLPSGSSWQDLKDHTRPLVEDFANVVGYANVERNGTGVIDFKTREAMEEGLKTLQDSEFKNRHGDTGKISVVHEPPRGGGRDRSRSPRGRRSPSPRGRRRDRSRSPRGRRSPSRSYSPRGRSASRSRSRSRSGSRSRTPPRSPSPGKREERKGDDKDVENKEIAKPETEGKSADE